MELKITFFGGFVCGHGTCGDVCMAADSRGVDVAAARAVAGDAAIVEGITGVVGALLVVEVSIVGHAEKADVHV